MSQDEQEARDTYRLMSNNELKDLRKAFKRDLRRVVAKAKRDSFITGRIAIINEILEERR